jgi:hypothetical protein
MRKQLLLLLSFLIASICAFGQTPTKRFIGCHHKHHQHAKPNSLNMEERVLLNESIARSDTFDIIGYIIHIDVTDYTNSYIKAGTTVSLVPKMEGQTSVRLDLMNLQVDSVKQAEDHLNFQYDDSILTVHFLNTPSLTDTLSFTVHYQGVPQRDPEWGGFYFENQYIYNLGIGLSSIPPNFGKVWYPCFDSFVERATYEYHVKSAGTYRAHCQGEFLGEIQLGGDTVIRSFAMHQAIPTHLSAIAVANYQNIDYVHVGAFGDVPVRLTGKPAHINSMSNALQNVGAAIDACEHWYGPHAWERVGYVLTTDGALEIPTNIAYPQYMVTQSIAANNGLLSHELGHHWWGDVVTPYNHNDMWLKEGPAEYSSHLMEEWLYGDAAFVDMVKTNHLDVLRNAHIDDEGYHPLSPMPDEQIYGTHTYYKGASAMHNLRGYMGDEAFRLGMTTVQQERYFQTITPEEFRDELQSATGVNLNDFFADQIFKPGFSVFVTDSIHVASNNTGGYTTTLYLQQKLRACPSFYNNVPLDITLVSGTNQRINHLVSASGQFSNFDIESDFLPEMVIINGFNRLNQARMDHEFHAYNGTTISGQTRYVDLEFNTFNTVDSSLVRIEHIWAAPDQGTFGPGVDEISDQHYWIVDGLWNEADHFRAVFPYNGNSATKLDYDLYFGNEANAVLLFRENAASPWRVYEDFLRGPGGVTDGNGTLLATYLRKGQYAFGNGDPTIGVDDILTKHSAQLTVFPVPAKDNVTIRGQYTSRENAVAEITTIDGKLQSRTSFVADTTFELQLPLEHLSQGNYLVQLRTQKGEPIGTTQLHVGK